MNYFTLPEGYISFTSYTKTGIYWAGLTKIWRYMAEFTVPDFYLKCELLSALHRSEWRAKGLPLDPDPATLSTTFELSEWAPNPSLFFLGTLDQVKAFFKKSPNLLDGLKGEIIGFNHSTFAECSSWDYNKVKEVTEHLNAGFCDTDSMALRISMTAWAALNFIDIIHAEIWQSEYETSLTDQQQAGPPAVDQKQKERKGRQGRLFKFIGEMKPEHRIVFLTNNSGCKDHDIMFETLWFPRYNTLYPKEAIKDIKAFRAAVASAKQGYKKKYPNWRDSE